MIRPECLSQAYSSRLLCEVFFALLPPVSSSRINKQHIVSQPDRRKCQSRGFPLLVHTTSSYPRGNVQVITGLQAVWILYLSGYISCILRQVHHQSKALTAEQSLLAAKIRQRETVIFFTVLLHTCPFSTHCSFISVQFKLKTP